MVNIKNNTGASQAKSFILEYLSSHETASISEMHADINSKYPNTTYSVFSGALGQLRRSGQIVSMERGIYTLAVSNKNNDPFISCIMSAEVRIEHALAKALGDIVKCRTTLEDFCDMNAYLAKAAILKETKDFLVDQLDKISNIKSVEVSE